MTFPMGFYGHRFDIVPHVIDEIFRISSSYLCMVCLSCYYLWHDMCLHDCTAGFYFTCHWIQGYIAVFYLAIAFHFVFDMEWVYFTEHAGDHLEPPVASPEIFVVGGSVTHMGYTCFPFRLAIWPSASWLEPSELHSLSYVYYFLLLTRPMIN